MRRLLEAFGWLENVERRRVSTFLRGNKLLSEHRLFTPATKIYALLFCVVLRPNPRITFTSRQTAQVKHKHAHDLGYGSVMYPNMGGMEDHCGSGSRSAKKSGKKCK